MPPYPPFPGAHHQRGSASSRAAAPSGSAASRAAAPGATRIDQQVFRPVPDRHGNALYAGGDRHSAPYRGSYAGGDRHGGWQAPGQPVATSARGSRAASPAPV